jgi:hypothetical protein
MIGSGLAGQFGIGEESTYGTRVSPTRYYEIIRETVTPDIGAIEHFGLNRGRYLRADRRKTFARGGGGQVEMTLLTKSFGLLFKHLCGGAAIAQEGATDEYLQTFTPGTDGLKGKMVSMQFRRPDSGATGRVFDYAGTKFPGWELKCDLDDRVRLIVDTDVATEVTNQSLGSASYPADADFFSFSEGALEIGGSPVRSKSVSVKWLNPVDTTRRALGNVKEEPIDNGEATVMVTLDPEFIGLSHNTAWKAGTPLEDFELTFDTGVAIPDGDGGTFSFQVVIPLLYPVEGGVNVQGTEVLREKRVFKAADNGSDAVYSLLYRSDDTAA